MSEFFSGKRFQLLILQHWADNRKRYLLSVLAYIGLMILWFFVAILANSQEPFDKEFQRVTFYLTLFPLGCSYASQYFGHFSSQAKGINFLMVPASHFEKLLCSLLYTVVFFLIAITACFYLVDIPATNFMKWAPPAPGARGEFGTANVFDVVLFDFADQAMGRLILVYLSAQSVFLFGSVLFKKYSFLKTCISGLVIGLLSFIVIYLANKAGFDNNTIDMFPYWVREVVVVFTWLTPPFFWVLTYFRLKAKQV